MCHKYVYQVIISTWLILFINDILTDPMKKYIVIITHDDKVLLYFDKRL